MAIDIPNEDQLRRAFEAAPKDVREFIELGGFDAAMGVLRNEAGLEESVLQKAELEILMALLGATDPEMLPANLTAQAGLSNDEVARVVTIAAAYVFAPLAEDDAVPSSESPLPVPAEPHELSTHVAPQPPRTQVPAAPASPLATFHAEAARAVTQAPAAAMRPPVPAAPPRPIPPPPRVEAVPPPPQPAAAPSVYDFHARTMASDIEAMQPGKGTGAAPRPPSMPVRPAAVPPVSSPITAAKPLATPAAAAPSTPPQSEVHADLRQYGIDPYREPIE